MFYLNKYNETKIIEDIDQEISITIDARSKYHIEEGLCSLVIPDRPIIVHWFHKVDLDKIVNAHSANSPCVVNTAHPCVLINNTDEKIKIVIKNLNNVIETYKNLLTNNRLGRKI